MDSHTTVIPNSFVCQKLSGAWPSHAKDFLDLLSSKEGIISLGVGEPDFVTPQHIIEAAFSSLKQGHTKYTSSYGLLELRQELAKYLNLHYGIDYQPGNEILITTGTSEGLDLILRATLDPGDEVIFPSPSYFAYSPDVILAGGIPVPVPTNQKHNFTVSAADIESLITPRTKVILINYPTNPTGAVMSREALLEIAELAQQHNLLVISDEIYARLVYGIEHTCFASLPGMKESAILLGGFSKAYAMTGWRIGYIAANSQLIEAIIRIHQYTMLCAPIMSQMAAIQALKSGEADIERMVREYDRRRHVIVKGLNDIGLSCFEPKGAFYAFPSIEVTGMGSAEFSETLLMEEKVAVFPGSAFGQSGENFVRCSYATSLTNIEDALKRMGRFVSRHKKS